MHLIAKLKLRRELRTTNQDTPLLLAKPLATFVEKNINFLLLRLAAIATGLFVFISLLLAVVGIYSVNAHAVARRTRELGILIALALLVGQALSKMLHRVGPVDPLALGTSAVLIALGACFFPARRAAKIDSVVALRCE